MGRQRFLHRQNGTGRVLLQQLLVAVLLPVTNRVRVRGTRATKFGSPAQFKSAA